MKTLVTLLIILSITQLTFSDSDLLRMNINQLSKKTSEKTLSKLDTNKTFQNFSLSLQVFPAQTDSWDPEDDTFSTGSELGTPVSSESTHGPHTLSETDTDDWFSITLEAGVSYLFWSSGSTDTIAGIFAQDGDTILTVNDDSRLGLNFEIQFIPETSGVYYLLVNRLDDTVISTYTLHYKQGQVPTDVAPDEWDPADDVFGGATSLGVPTNTEQSHGPHTLSVSDTEDWFRFTLTAGENYDFWTTSDNDTYGELVTSDGTTLLAENDDSGDGVNFRIRFTPNTTGEFLLRITPFELTDFTYTLHYQSGLEFPVTMLDEWDPTDDVFENGTSLEIVADGEMTHGPHTLSPEDQEDWLEFKLLAGETYEFWSSGNIDTLAGIFLDDGNTLIISDDDGGEETNFRFQFTPEQDGVFYLLVTIFDLESAGAYTLHFQKGITIPVNPGDEWDPFDDTYQTATVLRGITDTASVHGPHTLSSVDVSDWFRLTLKSGIQYIFESTGDSDLVGTLVDSSGETIVAFDDDSGSNTNFRIQFSPSESNLYYLRITSFFSVENSSYSLEYFTTIDEAPSTGDQWDPTDNIFQGATFLLEPGLTIQSHGPHSLSPSDEFDWFAVLLEQGSTYRFSSEGDANLFGRLYASDGQTIVFENDTTGVTSDFELVYTPGLSDLYYLRISQLGEENVNYTLQYIQTGEAIPFENDEWDPVDDLLSGATNLGRPEAIIQSHGPHTLSQNDVIDWFQFDVLSGQRYEIQTTGGADLFGTVLATDGQTVLYQDDDGGEGLNFLLTFVAEQTGIIYLGVEAFTNGINAQYELRWNSSEQGNDTWDPNDDTPMGATELDMAQNDTQIHGPHRLSTTDIADWFRFTFQGGVTYDIFSNGSSDTIATLYQTDGETVVRTDDDSGAALNFFIRFTSSNTSEYLLKVEEINNDEAAYNLHYQIGDEVNDIDEWDPADDSPGTATILGNISEKISHGPHTLSISDTDDWFLVTLNEGVRYRIWSTGNSDPSALLFDSNTAELVSNDDDSGMDFNFEMIYIPEASGEFFLNVHPAVTVDNVEYQLNISIETTDIIDFYFY